MKICGCKERYVTYGEAGKYTCSNCSKPAFITMSVSETNGWRQIWNKYKDHPRLTEIKKEHAESSNHSCVMILEGFVGYLIAYTKTLESAISDAVNGDCDAIEELAEDIE